MRKVIVLAAAVVAVATPALAAERLSDAQFIKASRCLGLAQSQLVGEADTAALEALIKTQGLSRPSSVSDRAADSKVYARREGRRAEGERRAALVGEWEGACRRITGA